jgi:peptidoglycan hydrolase-like protein with peptidoglycan-binding domain
MKIGTGLALIAIGAILAFAVTTNTSVFNLHTAGYVLIIVGIIGIAIPRSGYGWVGRRVFTRQTRGRPSARVEEIRYPTYVNRNPASTRVQAGLPAPASPESASRVDSTRDLTTEVRPVDEQEVIEDVYDE